MTDEIGKVRLTDDSLDNEMDLGSFDDIELDLSGDGLGGSEHHTNRKPDSPLKQFVTGAAKGAGSGLRAAISDTISREMPETTALASDIKQTYQDFKGLKEEISQQLAPMMVTLENSARKLLPRAKGYVPKALYDKLQKKFDERYAARKEMEYRAPTKEEMETSQIADELKTIFDSSIQLDSSRRLADKESELQQMAVGAVRHKQSQIKLQHIYDSMRETELFHKTTFTAYLKKSLELKYKHLFVARDTFNLLDLSTKKFEGYFKSLVHNTMLPDMAKIQMGDYHRRNQTARYGARLDEFMTGAKNKIFNVAKKKAKDAIQNAGWIVDQLNTVAETAQAMEGLEGLGLGGETAQPKGSKAPGIIGKGLASVAAFFGGGSALEGIADKLRPFTKDFDGAVADTKANAMLNLAKLRRQWTEQSDSRLKSFLADFLPDFERTATGNNDLLDKGTEASQFDNLTKQSIVEIIPGYLGKIWHSIEKIRTGDDNVEEQIYNVYSRKFTGVSTLKADAGEYMFGTEDDRRRAIEGAIGTLQAGMVRNNPKENAVDRYKGLEKDINRVLLNHAVRVEFFTPEEIRTFLASSDDVVPSSYIRNICAGLEHDPRVVLKAIYDSIFDKDGDMDKRVVADINRSITQVRKLDAYKSELPKINEVYGYRHVFADSIDDRTRQRLFKVIEKGGPEADKAKEILKKSLGLISDQNKINLGKIVEDHADIDYSTLDRENIKNRREERTDRYAKSDESRATAGYYADKAGINKGASAFMRGMGGITKFYADLREKFIPEWERESSESLQALRERVKKFYESADSLELGFYQRYRDRSAAVAQAAEEAKARGETPLSEEVVEPAKTNIPEIKEQKPTRTAGSAVVEAKPSVEWLSMLKPSQDLQPEMLSVQKEILEILKAGVKTESTDEGPAAPSAVTPVVLPPGVGPAGSGVDNTEFAALFREFSDKYDINNDDRRELLEKWKADNSEEMGILFDTMATWREDQNTHLNSIFDAIMTVNQTLGGMGTTGGGAGAGGGDHKKQGIMGKIGHGLGVLGRGVGRLYVDTYSAALRGAGHAMKGVGFAAGKGFEALKSGFNMAGKAMPYMAGGLKNIGKGYVKIYGHALDAIGGVGKAVAEGLFGRKTENYVDIYRKDEIGGNYRPILTRVRQERDPGVFFKSGERVKKSSDIHEPVYDAESKPLISQDDIDHGLVDVNNKPLGSGGPKEGIISKVLDIVRGGGKGLGKLGLKTFDLYKDIYGKLFGLVGDGARGIGRGIGKVFGRLFGTDNKDGYGLDGKETVDLLKKILTEVEIISGQYKRESGDKDGDGDIEGSYEDQMQKKKLLSGPEGTVAGHKDVNWREDPKLLGATANGEKSPTDKLLGKAWEKIIGSSAGKAVKGWLGKLGGQIAGSAIGKKVADAMSKEGLKRIGSSAASGLGKGASAVAKWGAEHGLSKAGLAKAGGWAMGKGALARQAIVHGATKIPWLASMLGGAGSAAAGTAGTAAAGAGAAGAGALGALGSVALPAAAVAAALYAGYRGVKGFGKQATMENLGIKDERDVLFEDRMASALGLNTKWGAKGVRAIQSVNPLIGLIKGIRGNDNPMTEKEIEIGRAKLQNKAKKGLPGYDKILSEYEKALEDHNWSRARHLSGTEADGIIKQMWNHSITGKVTNFVVGGAWNLMFGKKDEEMTKEEIEKTRAKFQSIMKRGGTAGKNAEKLLDKFNDYVAEQNWKKAREIAGMEKRGVFGKLFQDSKGNIKLGTVLGTAAGFALGGPVGALLYGAIGSLFNKTDPNAPMTEQEVKTERQRLEKLAHSGNKYAEKILSEFDDAVVEQNWKKVRRLCGKEVKSNLAKLGSGIKSTMKWTSRIGSLGLSMLFESDDSNPMTQAEMDKFVKKQRYLIDKKHSKSAERKLDAFEKAVAREDWRKAREIAKIPDQMAVTKAAKATWRFFFGNDDAEMSEEEMQKFRDSMGRKIKMGGSFGKAAERKLDAFEDAVGRQNWRKARAIAQAPDDGIVQKSAKAIGKAFAGTFRFIFGGDKASMSESELARARKILQNAVDDHKKGAQQRLDRFEDFVADEKWDKARALVKMPYENAIKRGAKAIKSWLFGGDNMKEMTPEEIQNFQEECEARIADGNKKAAQLLEKFNAAVAAERWDKARAISNTKDEGVWGDAKKGAAKVWKWITGGKDRKDCEEMREKIEEKTFDDETGAYQAGLEAFEALVRRRKFKEACELGEDILKFKPNELMKRRKLKSKQYEALAKEASDLVAKITKEEADNNGLVHPITEMKLSGLRKDVTSGSDRWGRDFFDEVKDELAKITGKPEYMSEASKPDDRIFKRGEELLKTIDDVDSKRWWIGSPVIKTRLGNLRSEVKSNVTEWDDDTINSWYDRIGEIDEDYKGGRKGDPKKDENERRAKKLLEDIDKSLSKPDIVEPNRGLLKMLRAQVEAEPTRWTEENLDKWYEKLSELDATYAGEGDNFVDDEDTYTGSDEYEGDQLQKIDEEFAAKLKEREDLGLAINVKDQVPNGAIAHATKDAEDVAWKTDENGKKTRAWIDDKGKHKETDYTGMIAKNPELAKKSEEMKARAEMLKNKKLQACEQARQYELEKTINGIEGARKIKLQSAFSEEARNKINEEFDRRREEAVARINKKYDDQRAGVENDHAIKVGDAMMKMADAFEAKANDKKDQTEAYASALSDAGYSSDEQHKADQKRIKELNQKAFEGRFNGETLTDKEAAEISELKEKDYKVQEAKKKYYEEYKAERKKAGSDEATEYEDIRDNRGRVLKLKEGDVIPPTPGEEAAAAEAAKPKSSILGTITRGLANGASIVGATPVLSPMAKAGETAEKTAAKTAATVPKEDKPGFWSKVFSSLGQTGASVVGSVPMISGTKTAPVGNTDIAKKASQNRINYGKDDIVSETVTYMFEKYGEHLDRDDGVEFESMLKTISNMDEGQARRLAGAAAKDEKFLSWARWSFHVRSIESLIGDDDVRAVLAVAALYSIYQKEKHEISIGVDDAGSMTSNVSGQIFDYGRSAVNSRIGVNLLKDRNDPLVADIDLEKQPWMNYARINLAAKDPAAARKRSEEFAKKMWLAASMNPTENTRYKLAQIKKDEDGLGYTASFNGKDEHIKYSKEYLDAMQQPWGQLVKYDDPEAIANAKKLYELRQATEIKKDLPIDAFMPEELKELMKEMETNRSLREMAQTPLQKLDANLQKDLVSPGQNTVSAVSSPIKAPAEGAVPADAELDPEAVKAAFENKFAEGGFFSRVKNYILSALKRKMYADMAAHPERFRQKGESFGDFVKRRVVAEGIDTVKSFKETGRIFKEQSLKQFNDITADVRSPLAVSLMQSRKDETDKQDNENQDEILKRTLALGRGESAGDAEQKAMDLASKTDVKFASGGFLGQALDFVKRQNKLLATAALGPLGLAGYGVYKGLSKLQGKFATKPTATLDGEGKPILYGESGTEAIMPIKSKPGNLLSRLGDKMRDIFSGKPLGTMSTGEGFEGSVKASDPDSDGMLNFMASQLAKSIKINPFKRVLTPLSDKIAAPFQKLGSLFSAKPEEEPSSIKVSDIISPVEKIMDPIKDMLPDIGTISKAATGLLDKPKDESPKVDWAAKEAERVNALLAPKQEGPTIEAQQAATRTQNELMKQISKQNELTSQLVSALMKVIGKDGLQIAGMQTLTDVCAAQPPMIANTQVIGGGSDSGASGIANDGIDLRKNPC